MLEDYLFDRSNRMSEIRRLFRRVYNARGKPGGLAVFDIAEGPGRRKGARPKVFSGARLDGPGRS